jgi:hypothetical protein
MRDRNKKIRNAQKVFVTKLNEGDQLENLVKFENDITTNLSNLVISRDAQDVEY